VGDCSVSVPDYFAQYRAHGWPTARKPKNHGDDKNILQNMLILLPL
jgi:hypothetical protein